MTPDDHVAFTRRLGKLHVMVPTDFNLPGHPEVFVVGNAVVEGKPLGLRRAGMGFHTDGEDKLVPNAGSFSMPGRCPRQGATRFSPTCMPSTRRCPRISVVGSPAARARFSRAALHAVNYPHLPPLSPAQLRDRPDVWHPLERRHPRSFRVALYIGRWACDIEGLPEAEGREIVAFLQEFARQERFVYRHHWLNGDAVLWDNRCTQHCATMFDEARHTRLMHRTTLEGDAPIMA